MDRRAIEAAVLRHRHELLAPETEHKLAMIDMPPDQVLAWTRRLLLEATNAPAPQGSATPTDDSSAHMDTSFE